LGYTDEASEFTNAFQKYANACSGLPLGDAFTGLILMAKLAQSLGDTTIWVIAPDATTAQTISGLGQP
jgi:hypothetical protein